MKPRIVFFFFAKGKVGIITLNICLSYIIQLFFVFFFLLLGTSVFRLEGSDPENSPVYYGLEGTNLLAVDRDTGEVTVKNNIDREVRHSPSVFADNYGLH